MTAVVFSAGEFRTEYPPFADDADYSDALLTSMFDTAVMLLGNETSPVPYDPAQSVYDRRRLLYAATCHLLTLADGGDQPGRVTSASQGSVSTSFDLLKTNSYTGDFWAQTACGRIVWLILLPYIKGGRLYTTRSWHPWG